jgi:hypothetical protein
MVRTSLLAILLSKGKRSMFANTIKALTVAVALTAVSSTAMADQYRHRQHQRQHHGYNHHRNNNMALGIGLGLLGAGLAGAYYYNQRPAPQQCWNELSGYDYRGRPVYTVVCY